VNDEGLEFYDTVRAPCLSTRLFYFFLSIGEAFLANTLRTLTFFTFFFTLLQERMPHLFHKRDRENGQLSVCPDRVKTFSQLLKDKIDTDGDGRISKGEFIRGYCIWQMHIKKAAMHQVQKGGGKQGRKDRKESEATVFASCRLRRRKRTRIKKTWGLVVVVVAVIVVVVVVLCPLRISAVVCAV